VPERLTKIDAEIFAAEQKLKEVLAIEKHAAVTARIEELKKRRQEILEEMEKEKRERIK
jgi:hypothetical protein